MSAMTMSTSNELRPTAPPPTGPSFTLPRGGVALDEVERQLIEQALDRTHGKQTEAAQLLRISRYALRYRMKKFGIGERFARAASPPRLDNV